MKCFKKDYRKPSRDYGSHGTGESFKPVWGYVVAHGEGSDLGCFSHDKKWSETTHGEAVAVLTELPWEDRKEGRGVSGACRNLKKMGCNASWEDHRNAYKYPKVKAEGYEILYLAGDELSKKYAEIILEEFARRYPGRKNRGLKAIKKGGRGYRNLLAAKKAGMDVALLGELFFLDNPRDFLSPKAVAEFLKDVLA